MFNFFHLILNHCLECTPVRSPSVVMLRSPPAYSERSCPSDKSIIIITASGMLTTVITPLHRHTATVHSKQGVAQCAVAEGWGVQCTRCPARCSGKWAMTGIHEIFILINYSLMMGWWLVAASVWDQRPADMQPSDVRFEDVVQYNILVRMPYSTTLKVPTREYLGDKHHCAKKCHIQVCTPCQT